MSNFDFLIGNRLEQIRDRLGFTTQKAFAEKLGLKYQSYVNYEKGGRSLPDEIKFKLFGLGVNISWLVTGQGEPLLDNQDEKVPLMEELKGLIEKTMEPRLGEVTTRLTAIEAFLKEKEVKPAPAPAAPSKDTPEEPAKKEDPLYIAESEPEYGEEEAEEEEYEQVPYVRDIAAGPPINQSEDQSGKIAVPARLIRKSGKYYAASIRGTSMTEAGIRDGDMVLIRHADAPKDGVIQVIRHGDKSTLKRVWEVEGKGWELHYEDGTGRVITYGSGDYEVQGEFVAVLPENAVRPSSQKPLKRARTR